MEIKSALSYLNEIIDICAQLENSNLDEICSDIYTDAQCAKSIEAVIENTRELMVFINEQSWSGEENLREEIETVFNQLLEEYDEF